MLELFDLDERTRHHMLSELRQDIESGRLHLPARLTPLGDEVYPLLLEAAFEAGDDATLAAALRAGDYLEPTELSRTRTGKTIRKRVPCNAAETLAEEAFNRYYVRAVCLRALERGQRTVEVYRAKQVAHPRPESQGKLTYLIQPERLLADLRAHVGDRTELGVPAGPNSGVSVRLPRPKESVA